jgi:diguanylate cyclase (GGDEF)-like protein
LTGLGNRRWLKDIGSLEIARAARERMPISVVVFDLDHFKSINDEFGHDVGDHVLMTAGAAIQHNLRPYDIAARIGGKEFCRAPTLTAPLPLPIGCANSWRQRPSALCLPVA